MIPIFIYHLGNQEYFKRCVTLNSKYNHVYVVGDDSNKDTFQHNDNVTHIHVNSFSEQDYPLIRRAYDCFRNNSSDNGGEFGQLNLLWNLRVFYLNELMNRTKITSFLHLDSDCILLEKTQNIPFPSDICFSIQKFSQQTNPYHMVGSIHNGLLNKKFCDKFIELFFDIYENKSKDYLVEPKRNWHRTSPGYVCDMTLYYILYSEKLIEVFDLNEILMVGGEECIFDHQYSSPYGYLGTDTYTMENGVKLTHTNNGNVYFKTSDGKLLRTLSMHFQGGSKSILETLTNDSFV
jgi:hypothetical protein